MGKNITSTPPRFRLHGIDQKSDRITWWLVGVTALVIVTGMAYTLWWPAVVRHHSWYWTEPGDIWGTVRAAHWVGWGGLSFLYSANTALVTLPGFPILLTPFVVLSSALGLSETAPGFLPIAKPTAWLLIGPLTLACSAVAIFAFDGLARALCVGRGTRRVLAVIEGVALWQALAIWGHPEDVVALGLAVLAVVQVLRGHLALAGWLLGAAIGMQLFVIAVIPIFIAIVGLRRIVPLLLRSAVIPGALFLVVVIPNPHATMHYLFDQPNFPRVDHPTPWVSLAPHLAHGAVAAGPGRIIGLLVAVFVGWLVWRMRDNPRWILWGVAAALASRVVFESVLDPYYLVPFLGVALISGTQTGRVRWATAGAVAGGITVLAFQHFGEWIYWGGLTGGIGAMLVLTWPTTRQPHLTLGEIDQRVRADIPLV